MEHRLDKCWWLERWRAAQECVVVDNDDVAVGTRAAASEGSVCILEGAEIGPASKQGTTAYLHVQVVHHCQNILMQLLSEESCVQS